MLLQVVLASVLAIPFLFRRTVADVWHRVRGNGDDVADARSPSTPQRRPITPAEGPVVDPASFRDPSGFVFRRDGVLFRQVQPFRGADWEAPLDRPAPACGRRAADRPRGGRRSLAAASPDAVAVIRPRLLARSRILTSGVQPAEGRGPAHSRDPAAGARRRHALKDASAYNVQFDGPADPHRHALVRARARPTSRGRRTASSASTSWRRWR